MSLKSCRDLASMKLTAICWSCRYLHRKELRPFFWGLVAGGPFPPLFLWRSLSRAPPRAGHFDGCWGVVLPPADNVLMARAVQFWMTQCHLCQEFIFSTFCPTDTSLRCVSSICLSDSMLLFKWRIKPCSQFFLPKPFHNLSLSYAVKTAIRSYRNDCSFICSIQWVPHGHDFRL